MQKYFRQLSSTVGVAILMMPIIGVFTPHIATALEGEPILIETCDDLNLINDDLAGDYQLADDINCATTADDNPNVSEWDGEDVGGTLIADPLDGVVNNGYNGFEPIGDIIAPFTGTLDGNGKTISNLWIFRKDTAFVGLFAYTQNASITNLTLNGSSIVGNTNSGGLVGLAENTSIQGVTIQSSMTRAYLSYRGGGIVGEMYHNLENDTPAYIIDSSVISGNVHGSGNIIGGLVGSMNGGVISGSSSSADVDGGYSIGGIVGELSSGTITNTTVGEAIIHSDYSEDSIAKSGDKIGGFVGSMSGGTIYNSSTDAAVEAEGSNVGGFVGDMQSFDEENRAVINSSYATGTVTGFGNVNDNSTYGNQNSNAVGGFAGYASGYEVEITNSYSTGNVVIVDVPLLDDSYGIGGFIGVGGCSSTISQSYATGDVTAPTAYNVGGLVGDDGCEGPGGTYDRVYATGSVEGLEEVGGLFGRSGSTSITKSYATGSVTGNVNVGGLSGYNTGGALVSQSYATGNVTALETTAGGLFGYFGGLAEDVYARGSVTGPLNVGGFAGEANWSWTIRRAYTTGAVTADPGTPQGFIGEDNTSSDVIAEGLYYDQQSSGVSTDEYATAKNTDQLKLIVNQPTYEGYDFEDVWEFTVGQNNDYPLFQWQLDPIGQILCEQARMTATTGRINCEVTYSGGDESRAEPESWMNPQYRISGDTEWTSMDWTASSEGKHTFYNLEPNTEYELSMTVANNIINQQLISVGITLPIDSDVDTDGILDITENESPNNGDANSDGMLDAEQEDVTSYLNSVTNKYNVLQTDCTTNTAVSTAAESSSTKDPAFDYTAGLMSFTAIGCSSEATITQHFYGDYDAAKYIARKYNPSANSYATIPGVVLTNVTINSQSALKITYKITDNGPLDLSPSIGTITDPAGPALAVVGVPNTGL